MQYPKTILKYMGLGVAVMFLIGECKALGQEPAVGGYDNIANCKMLVGGNVQVSKEESSIYETFIAVNPKNPKNLIAAAVLLPFEGGNRDTLFYLSEDAGRSWSKAPVKFGIGVHDSTDPIVLFTRSGSAIFASFHDLGNRTLDNLLQVSSDGGRTVGPVERPTSDLDHWMPAVDLSHGAYSGSIYLFGKSYVPAIPNYGLRLVLLRSRTNGRDWTKLNVVKSRELLDDPSEGSKLNINNIANGTLISRSGKLFLFFESQFPNHHFLITSGDGGNSFSKPQQLKNNEGKGLVDPGQSNTSAFAIDTSQGPFTDRIYAVWLSQATQDGGARLYFSSSSDGGASWAESLEILKLEELTPGWEEFVLPTLTVNKHGVLLVGAYSFEKGTPATDSDQKQIRAAHTRIVTASIDGGKTFLKARALASEKTGYKLTLRKNPDGEREGLSDEDWNSKKVFLMDYLNTTVDSDGTFHALWMDGRTGIQQMQYAPVRVLCNGKPAKAQLPKNR